jgi:hypothetical protein
MKSAQPDSRQPTIRAFRQSLVASDNCGTPCCCGIDAQVSVQQTEGELPALRGRPKVHGMSTYPPPPGPGGVGRRLEEAIELIEMELRHAVAYVNDAVVPQVRRESISAMRTVADTLRNLADRMDQNAGGPPGGQKDPKV